MHCPAIPSNLDRAKQVSIDSIEQPCLLLDRDHRFGNLLLFPENEQGALFPASERVKNLLPPISPAHD
jgi:hypothetical protein